MSLKVVLILANSADSDEMQHYAAFCLGLHCLPKFSFRGFQYTKVNVSINAKQVYFRDIKYLRHCELFIFSASAVQCIMTPDT